MAPLALGNDQNLMLFKEDSKVEPVTPRIELMRMTQRNLRNEISTEGLRLLGLRLYAKDHEGNEKPSVRAYFITFLYQYLKKCNLNAALNNDLVSRIAMVGEFCITTMYLENHHQDQKYGVIDEPSRCINRNDLRLTKQALDRYIAQNFSGKIQHLVNQAVKKLFYFYEKGMELDKDALSYENFITNNPNHLHRINPEVDAFVAVDDFVKALDSSHFTKYKPIQQTNYLRLLLTRDFLINTVFFQVFTELMIQLFGQKGQSFASLVTFARFYGMAQQLVNDNCDYLPVSYGFKTVCKLEEDTFSDMRRTLLTLPIAAFFAQTQTQEGDIFSIYTHSHTNRDLFEDGDQRWLLHLLIDSGAMSHSLRIVSLFSKRAIHAIGDPRFNDLFSFTQGNRFYKEYKSFSYD